MPDEPNDAGRPPDATPLPGQPADSRRPPPSAPPPLARPVVTAYFEADAHRVDAGSSAASGAPEWPRGRVVARAIGARPVSPLALPSLTRRQAVLDLGLVLFVCLALPIAQGTVLAMSGQAPTREGMAAAMSLPAKIVEASTACALALYVGLQHRLHPRGFGLSIRRLPVQVGWGVVGLVAVYVYLAATVVAMIPFAPQLQHDLEKRVDMFRLLEDQLERPGAVALLLVPVVVHEELLFRGLLLPLLRRACGGWVLAVLVASAAFGALHLLQGVFGAVQIFGLSIVLSLCFIWSRSLIAVMLAHYAFDFVQMVLVVRYVREFLPAGS